MPAISRYANQSRVTSLVLKLADSDMHATVSAASNFTVIFVSNAVRKFCVASGWRNHLSKLIWKLGGGSHQEQAFF
ncbi:MAG TPA: hypothetical protein VIT66_14215 [Lysobacter sp.]